MSEFEFVEASYLNSSYLATAAMNFVAVFLAYVVAAHFAGKLMSRVVAVSVSIIYSLFLLAPSSTVISASARTLVIRAQYQLQFPDGVLVPAVELTQLQVSVFIIGPLVMGWLGS